MERLTRADGEGYAVDEAFIGKAIDRLAKFENMLERLLNERDETAARLETLRKEGREKSVTFKQLLARKLTNSNMLALLESHGIETSVKNPMQANPDGILRR